MDAGSSMAFDTISTTFYAGILNQLMAYHTGCANCSLRNNAAGIAFLTATLEKQIRQLNILLVKCH